MFAAAVGVLFASGRVITWWCCSLLATIIALLLLFLRVKKDEPQKGRSSEHKPINNRKKRKKRKKRVKQRTNRHERKTCDTQLDSGATCSVPHAANCTKRRLNSVKEEGQLRWQKRKERFVKQRELKERRRIERKERLREEREQKENEQREQKVKIKEAKIRQRERKQKEQGKQSWKKTEAPGSVANLLNLPHEILLFIFGSLSIVDLCTICQVNRQLLLLAEDDFLWKLLYGTSPAALKTDSDNHKENKVKQSPQPVLGQGKIFLENRKAGVWKKKVEEREMISRNWRRGEYGEKKLCGHRTSVYSMCLCADNDGLLISGSADGQVKVWDLSTYECIETVEEHRAGVNCISLQGNTVVSGSSSDGLIKFWNFEWQQYIMQKRKALSRLGESGLSEPLTNDRILCSYDALYHPGVYCLQFSEQHNLLMSGSNSDGDIKLWKTVAANRSREVSTLRGHRGGICCLQFDNKKLITGSEDRTLKIWDYSRERDLTTLYGHKSWVRCLQFNENGLWTGSSDKTIMQWDLATQSCVKVIDGTDIIRCLQVDGYKLVAAQWDGVILGFDLRTYRPYEKLKYRNIIYCMQMDHTSLFTGSHDATVQVWDFKNVDYDFYE